MTRRIGRRDSDASPIERGGERVAGQHAGQQPHRRAGIAGVERGRGRTESPETSSQ